MFVFQNDNVKAPRQSVHAHIYRYCARQDGLFSLTRHGFKAEGGALIADNRLIGGFTPKAAAAPVGLKLPS